MCHIGQAGGRDHWARFGEAGKGSGWSGMDSVGSGRDMGGERASLKLCTTASCVDIQMDTDLTMVIRSETARKAESADEKKISDA